MKIEFFGGKYGTIFVIQSIVMQILDFWTNICGRAPNVRFVVLVSFQKESYISNTIQMVWFDLIHADLIIYVIL